MIGMRVRYENGGRLDLINQMQPIRAAIEHDSGLRAPHEQCAVTAMQSGFYIDFAARTQKKSVRFCPAA